LLLTPRLQEPDTSLLCGPPPGSGLRFELSLQEQPA